VLADRSGVDPEQPGCGDPAQGCPGGKDESGRLGANLEGVRTGRAGEDAGQQLSYLVRRGEVTKDAFGHACPHEIGPAEGADGERIEGDVVRQRIDHALQDATVRPPW
jgi:hypothetical protein